MIKLITFGCCIALIILLTSKRPALVQSRFHGYWTGRCNVDDSQITLNVLINDEGKISGIAFIQEEEQFDIIGKAEANGYCNMVGMFKEAKFQFEGSINESTAFGTFTKNGMETSEWNAYKI